MRFTIDVTILPIICVLEYLVLTLLRAQCRSRVALSNISQLEFCIVGRCDYYLNSRFSVFSFGEDLYRSDLGLGFFLIASRSYLLLFSRYSALDRSMFVVTNLFAFYAEQSLLGSCSFELEDWNYAALEIMVKVET